MAIFCGAVIFFFDPVGAVRFFFKKFLLTGGRGKKKKLILMILSVCLYGKDPQSIIELSPFNYNL